MQYCNRCKKYLAVVYLSKAQGGGTDGEGVCLTCARKTGLPQVDEIIKRLGLSDDDLEKIQLDTLEIMREME